MYSTWLFLKIFISKYTIFRLWKKTFKYFIFWMKSSVVKWIIHYIMHFVSIWFQNVKPTTCLFANLQYMQNLQMIQNFLYLWNMKFFISLLINEHSMNWERKETIYIPKVWFLKHFAEGFQLAYVSYFSRVVSTVELMTYLFIIFFLTFLKMLHNQKMSF